MSTVKQFDDDIEDMEGMEELDELFGLQEGRHARTHSARRKIEELKEKQHLRSLDYAAMPQAVLRFLPALAYVILIFLFKTSFLTSSFFPRINNFGLSITLTKKESFLFTFFLNSFGL
jgi:hypothetical protein